MRILSAGLGLAIALSVGIGPALAERADVIRNEACTIIGKDGTAYNATRTIRIVTRSARNVVIFICKVDIPDYVDGVFTDRGFPCAVDTDSGAAITNLTQKTISAAGKGTLVCRVKD
jgi:hypothetical protein